MTLSQKTLESLSDKNHTADGNIRLAIKRAEIDSVLVKKTSLYGKPQVQ